MYIAVHMQTAQVIKGNWKHVAHLDRRVWRVRRNDKPDNTGTWKRMKGKMGNYLVKVK